MVSRVKDLLLKDWRRKWRVEELKEKDLLVRQGNDRLQRAHASSCGLHIDVSAALLDNSSGLDYVQLSTCITTRALISINYCKCPLPS